MIPHIFFSFLIVLQGKSVWCDSNVNDQVASFLHDNGFRFITLNGLFTWHHDQKLFDALRKHVYIRAHAETSRTACSDIDVQVFVVRSLHEISSKMLEQVSKNNVQRTLILSQTSLNAIENLELRQKLQSMNCNSLFYLATMNKDTVLWHQLFTMKGGYSLTNLAFHSGSHLISEQYDLNGLTIHSISGSWAPYMIIDKCDEQGKHCNFNSGYLVDFMNIMAEKFNFSYESVKEPNGDWGTVPKSGPLNLSGEWGGVMGNVVNGRFDMSMSPWLMGIERHELLQFALVIKSRPILVWEPRYPEVDFGLFIRPITYDSWMLILLLMFVVLSFMGLTSIFLPSLNDSEGRKLVMTTMYYFFVLINAFYGGALTMFFTSTITLPFETLRDVMKSNPEWKLLFMKGQEAFFAYPAFQGDTDYLHYWNYAKVNAKDASFSRINEGLERLKLGKTVIFLDESMLKGYLKNNPSHVQNLEIFWQGENKFMGIIFPLNSPLVPMFQKGAVMLRETGLMDILINRWQDHNMNEHSLTSTMVLGSGHTILVFVIMLSIYVLCLLLFWGEIAYSYITRIRS